MKKEEILEKSRKENKKKDVYAIEIELKAATLAAICMVCLAFIYFTYEIITGKGSNPAFYSLITMYNGILFGVKAIKIKDYRKTNAFSSIVWLLLTGILILDYFW